MLTPIVVTGQIGGGGGGGDDDNNNDKRDLPAIDVDTVKAVVVGRVPNLPRHLAEAVQSGALAPSAKFRRMLQEA